MKLPEHPTENLPVKARKVSRGNAISIIDAKIDSAILDELPALIRIRGELVAQEEARKNGELSRWGRKGIFYAKIGFSIAALAGGAVLIGTGFLYPGFFLLGGGVAIYVPDYVKDVVSQFGSGGDSAG